MKNILTLIFYFNLLKFLSNKSTSNHTFELRRYLEDNLKHFNHSDTSEIQGNITNLGYYYVCII
jgi:hypothetical protein